MASFIKIGNQWVPVSEVYKKVNGSWQVQSDLQSALGENHVYFFGGSVDLPTLSIQGQSEYTGKQFYLTAKFGNSTVYPTWSITSGGTYASINNNGKVSITEGAHENSITVQATYQGNTASKVIDVSYDNQLTIESSDTITGTSGNVIARYNSLVITPVWSITEGNQYATINSSGNIVVLGSGNIVVSATYEGYTTSKTISLVYESGSSSQTTVSEDGTVTTETTTVVENQDGSTTTTSTTEVLNDDGSSSTTSTETTENQDGSSTTTSTTTSSDGSSTETTSTTSAPDENGSVTTEENTTITNSDGTSSETSSTITENEDGSSSSQSETVHYDENGDTTGSTTNETEVNADGSSSSSTTNYNSSGDPTDQQNVATDTTGNIDTQDVEFNENGDPTVTGYTIDTGASDGSGKDLTGSGVDTEFIPFGFEEGFTMHLRFRTTAEEQPNPPVVADTEDTGVNYLYNIMSAKATAKVGNIWPGFDIRWAVAKSGSTSSATLQFRRTLVGESQTASTNILTRHIDHVYDLIITYNPAESTNKFRLHDNLAKEYALSLNKYLQDDMNLEVTLGYALNMQGQPYRYANVTVYDFSVNRLDTTAQVAAPTISCDGTRVEISCSTPGAKIYYRTDSSSKYNLYTSQFLISADTTVQAYAIFQHMISNVTSETCIFDDGTPAVPVITCDGLSVAITCATAGASIYYRLGGEGNYVLYTSPISINEDILVEAYSEKDGLTSAVVSENCDYDDGTPDNPVITCDGEYVTISCATQGAIIYYSTDGENYELYHSPVAIYEDTTFYAYSELNNLTSSIITEECKYEGAEPVHDYSEDYLTFVALTSGTISWKALGSSSTKTIEYSKNNGTWTSITSTSSGATISVSQGDSVRFRGTETKYCNGNKNNYSGFEGGTATYNIEGNIMSLLYGDNFVGQTTLSTAWVFCSIFKKSNVISAENLILPATTIPQCGYRAMFSFATQLEVAPALPATTLGTSCYWYMFEQCAITRAPDLLAPTLVQECYGYMFTGCSSLNYIKCLATTKSATSCLQNWTQNVAASGTFVKDANTSWTSGASGIPTGWIVYNDEVLASPVISCDGEHITITCDTSGADIYYKLNDDVNYSLYSSAITINEDTTVYAYSSKNGNQSPVITEECIYVEHIYKFSGLEIASGPLYYGSSGYEIKDSWNYSSYGTIYGKTSGSYYFSFLEMGALFEKTGFTTTDGNIDNSLDPLDGWRLPTSSEWASIIGTTRTGSTVNNSSSKHFALIQLSGGTTTGLLVFPDSEIITGAALANMDNSTPNAGITSEQLGVYLSQGCMFLPSSGYYDGTWHTGDIYWSSTEYNTTDAYTSSGNSGKSSVYCPVWLVKNAEYGTETPFEASNKSLSTWER